MLVTVRQHLYLSIHINFISTNSPNVSSCSHHIKNMFEQISICVSLFSDVSLLNNLNVCMQNSVLLVIPFPQAECSMHFCNTIEQNAYDVNHFKRTSVSGALQSMQNYTLKQPVMTLILQVIFKSQIFAAITFYRHFVVVAKILKSSPRLFCFDALIYIVYLGGSGSYSGR